MSRFDGGSAMTEERPPRESTSHVSSDAMIQRWRTVGAVAAARCNGALVAVLVAPSALACPAQESPSVSRCQTRFHLAREPVAGC